ncbi:hypothetical protein F4809DRAFT_656708 [Biscogniauxia mediterranea]|nr:hypothetical protein F4809DRAFT_656708 [Biscogniauxia mediterranea]
MYLLLSRNPASSRLYCASPRRGKHGNGDQNELSKIDLTCEALEELNRLTNNRCPRPFPPLAHTTINPRDLSRFSRHGGPDLCDLRGSRRGTKLTQPAFNLFTPTIATTKKTTPYNSNFEQHMTDHQIYPTYLSQKPDLTHIRTALVARRPSLSSSEFSDGAFEEFVANDDRAKDEDDVLANVILTILGPFDKPMAPNFFLEIKGRHSSYAVAKRQACYNGAMGSRAMRSLQNYGKDKPTGQLKLYAHHSTAPATPEGLPEYHMTHLGSYSLTGSLQYFRDGVTAFRNARDMAEQYRSRLIDVSNA